MNVELLSNGDWRNTKLTVDGAVCIGVTKIDIFVGDKQKATIEANKPISGVIPYGLVVNIKGVRYKTDASGKFIKSEDFACLATEEFEYKNVNVYKVD